MGGVPKKGGACESMRLSPCVLVQPDGWARGEREGYGEPCDVTSLLIRSSTRAATREATHRNNAPRRLAPRIVPSHVTIDIGYH